MTTGSDLAKRTSKRGGGGGGRGKSRSRSRGSGGGGAYKASILSVTVRNRLVNRYKVLIEGAASTFTAVMAVGAASTKEARHDHTHRPYT
jgi:hypothetical protein